MIRVCEVEMMGSGVAKLDTLTTDIYFCATVRRSVAFMLDLEEKRGQMTSPIYMSSTGNLHGKKLLIVTC